jgi:hypothetical protein
MSNLFTPAGSSNSVLVVPYVFSANAAETGSVVLYGEDITSTINVSADRVINLYFPVSNMSNVFQYTISGLAQDGAASNPISLSFSLASLTSAFDASFVADGVTSVSDDTAASVTTPFGDWASYYSNQTSNLMQHSDAVASVSHTHSCDHLLGQSSIVTLSTGWSNALKALYERSADAGKIDMARATTVGSHHWDLCQGDQVVCYVKYTESNAVNYSFDTNVWAAGETGFSNADLTFPGSIVVYFSGAPTPITISNASRSRDITYKLILTASG